LPLCRGLTRLFFDFFRGGKLMLSDFTVGRFGAAGSGSVMKQLTLIPRDCSHNPPFPRAIFLHASACGIAYTGGVCLNRFVAFFFFTEALYRAFYLFLRVVRDRLSVDPLLRVAPHLPLTSDGPTSSCCPRYVFSADIHAPLSPPVRCLPLPHSGLAARSARSLHSIPSCV